MSDDVVRWFAGDPQEGLPAVVAFSPWPTRRVLWVPRGGRVCRIGCPGPWTAVVLDDDLFLARSGTGASVQVIGEEVVFDADPRTRAGLDTCLQREPGGPWRVIDGPALPEGAAWGRTVRPWPMGRGVAWAADGYIYRWNLEGRPVAVATGARFRVGPDGVICTGEDARGALAFRANGEVVRPPEWTREVPPEDAEQGRTRIAGLRVTATRIEGGTRRGWTPDGAVVVEAYPSTGFS